jgi:thiol-disulfide isomerase/thioredoxin
MTRTHSLRGLAALFALALPLAAGPASSETDAAKTPIVAKIHADWCGTCTRLEPTWEELQARYGDDVRFVVLDVTDRDAVEQSGAEAERLGITPFFEKNKGLTGVVGVIDLDSGETRVFRGELDAKRYDEPIAAAIGAT